MTKAEINLINSKDVKVEELTPAMGEYLKIKHENPDKILLYRMGDFYETFFEDAVTMSKELELTLTGREQGNFGRIPLAGIPAKAVNNYIELVFVFQVSIANVIAILSELFVNLIYFFQIGK